MAVAQRMLFMLISMRDTHICSTSTSSEMASSNSILAPPTSAHCNPGKECCIWKAAPYMSMTPPTGGNR